MRIEAFQSTAPGRIVPISGYDNYLRREYKHHAFVPDPLPDSMSLSEGTYRAAAQAHAAIGRLDFATRLLPEPYLLVRPSLRSEAVATSALEGTHAPLQEVLESDFVDPSEQSDQVREIRNYIRAAEHGLEAIKTKPICYTICRELQAILVKDTRSDGASAGRLREAQVFIGERRNGIEKSRFVPPPPGDELVEGFSAWEKWLNAVDEIPLAVKIAVGHYQFETLHPFTDGNGRLGRLVAILQLIQAAELALPVLNISPWLEARKSEYKDLLLSVSQTGDFDPWVRFFCQGLEASARDAVVRIEHLLEFRVATDGKLRAVKARGVVVDVADDLIGYPVITANEVVARHKVTHPAAMTALRKLVELGVVQEIAERKEKLFVCGSVVDILLFDPDRGGTVL